MTGPQITEVSLSGSTWSCIFNFQGPPGCGSRSLSEVGRCRDNSVSYFRAKVYGLVVQVTHPLSPYIVYNSPKKQKIPPEEQNLRFALRRDVFRHDCYKFKKALDLKSTLRIILNLSENFLPFLCGMHDDKEEFSAHQLFMLCPLCFAVVIVWYHCCFRTANACFSMESSLLRLCIF